MEAPFWDVLRAVVAPVGSLRRLEVRDIRISLSQNDVVLLRQLTCLEELELSPTSDGGGIGLLGFPASLLSLTNLRRLDRVTFFLSFSSFLSLFVAVLVFSSIQSDGLCLLGPEPCRTRGPRRRGALCFRRVPHDQTCVN